MSNILSPEAKEFVPRQQTVANEIPALSSEAPPPDATEAAVAQPLNGLPSYMTTCFPFVDNR